LVIFDIQYIYIYSLLVVKSFRGKRLNVISGKLGAEWSEQKNRRKIALNHAEYRRSKILHERILPLSGCVAKKY